MPGVVSSIIDNAANDDTPSDDAADAVAPTLHTKVAGLTTAGQPRGDTPAGLGTLADTDRAAEAARLRSLQTRQQLATTALSNTDQLPSRLAELL